LLLLVPVQVIAWSDRLGNVSSGT